MWHLFFFFFYSIQLPVRFLSVSYSRLGFRLHGFEELLMSSVLLANSTSINQIYSHLAKTKWQEMFAWKKAKCFEWNLFIHISRTFCSASGRLILTNQCTSQYKTAQMSISSVSVCSDTVFFFFLYIYVTNAIRCGVMSFFILLLRCFMADPVSDTMVRQPHQPRGRLPEIPHIPQLRCLGLYPTLFFSLFFVLFSVC